MYQGISIILKILIEYFKDLSQVETKNFLKCLKFIETMELQKNINLCIMMKGIFNFESKIDLNEFQSLLELLLYHPNLQN